MEMKNLIDAYYKAESDRKLGRLRGKLMKQAKHYMHVQQIIRIQKSNIN